MNWLRKGPELKLSGLRIPTFLSDLYWDLRDRHLLALIALAVIAIAATPILLGGGSKHPRSGAEATLVSPLPSRAPTGGAKLAVVQAEPGLREPNKRLGSLPAKDPFQQQYTAPVINGSSSQSSTATTTTGGGSRKATTTTTGAGSPGGGAPSASTQPAPVAPPSQSSPSHLTFFTFAVDLKISLVRGGETSGAKSKNSDRPTIRHGIKPATPLPGKKAPMITYMGAIDNAKTALFMVSNEVTSVFGEGKCLSGTSTCQLLGVEAGFPEVFAYGFNHNRLKIEVLKIRPVVTGHS
jgi:hypothetical protein